MSCPHLFPVSLLCFCGGFEDFEVQPSWGPGNIRNLTPGLSWGLRGAGLWVPVLVSLLRGVSGGGWEVGTVGRKAEFPFPNVIIPPFLFPTVFELVNQG